MKTAKLGAIFLISIIALAGVGVGYAHWQETLYIDGTVNTGNLDVEWSFTYTNDPCTDVNDPGLINIVEETFEGPDGYTDIYALTGKYTTYEKDVTCVSMEITDDYPDLPTGTEPLNKILIVIDSAYPSYAPVIQFNAKNVGTIPVHIDGFTIEYDPDNDQGTDDSLFGEDAAKQMDMDGMELIAWEVTKDDAHLYGESKGTYTDLPIAIDTVDVGIMLFNDLLTYIMNGDNVQLHQGNWVDIHLIFHFQQHMEENDEFAFHMQAQFTQWNLAGDYP